MKLTIYGVNGQKLADFENGFTVAQALDAISASGLANTAGAIPVETRTVNGDREVRLRAPQGAQKA